MKAVQSTPVFVPTLYFLKAQQRKCGASTHLSSLWNSCQSNIRQEESLKEINVFGSWCPEKFSLWLTSHSRGLQFYPRLVNSSVVGTQTRKLGFFPLCAWEFFSCADEYNILQKGKKGDFPHNKFHCFHAVVMCKGRALCGRDILLYGKDIKSCCRSLSSLVPGLKLCEAVSQQRCLVLGFSL